MGTVVRGASSATPNFGLPAELGELADRYEFFGELGRGGSAIVYRACDRALGRDVAIKVVHPRPTSADDDAVARLAREARTVAQLQHPGIVTVYAVHRLQGGGLALVMQLVPGATLKQYIQQHGPFAPQRAEQIVRDVADALAYAHARQIIHRDVKPENIFVDAESGRALLADFGIARSGETDSMTMTGTAIGTPFYMSPEQIEGKLVDGRSDLYSLGLVAWEMLTAMRPWDGESLYHVIYKQKHDVLPPVEAIRQDVPRRLQYIIERMLQKQPAARWAGADGLLAQLDRTILPADYAHWQAALPARVARYRSAAAAPRATAPSAAERAGAANAATVQFARGLSKQDATRDTPALATTSVISTRDGQLPASVRSEAADASAATVAERQVEDHGDRTLTSDGAPARSDATAASTDTKGVYDVVTPSWASPSVDGPDARRRRGRSSWRAAGVVGGAALVAGAAASARTFITSDEVGGATAPLARFGISVPSATAPPRWAGRTAQGSAAVAASAGGDSTARDLIAIGAHHACEIARAGRAECWGENAMAQLGDGARAARQDTLRPVAGVMTYVGVAAGAAHTCGVTAAGDVYCWGANELGQLGDGTTIVRTAPVRIGGSGTYRSVRGGTAHTCALDVDGSVRCWGDNSLGQIGDGSHGARFVPTAVRLPSASAVAIATGGQHSCALLRDQRVFCWGSNIDGQLGASGTGVSATPREVPGVRARAIAAGPSHTCVALFDAAVRCWGRDDAGQLGEGVVSAGAADPTLGARPTDTTAPGKLTTLPGREAVRAVAAGASHSCALTRGGSVWCWGAVSVDHRGAPVRMGQGPYVALGAGMEMTCGAPASRAVECWAVTPAHAALTAAAPDTTRKRPTVRLRRRAGQRRVVRAPTSGE